MGDYYYRELLIKKIIQTSCCLYEVGLPFYDIMVTVATYAGLQEVF